jgi:osmotically-inducible protein OsmY
MTLPSLLIKDAELEATINRAIGARGNPHKIEVMVRDGYVHLLGWVDRLEEKKQIEATVEAIPGVRIVTNRIRAKATPAPAGNHF